MILWAYFLSIASTSVFPELVRSFVNRLSLSPVTFCHLLPSFQNKNVYNTNNEFFDRDFRFYARKPIPSRQGFGSKPVAKIDEPSHQSPSAIVESTSNQQTSSNENFHRSRFPTLKENFGIRLVHQNPPIYEVDNFFEESLCDEYIQRAQAFGERYESQTFSSQYGASSVRTSNTWYLYYKQVPEMLQRIRDLTNLPIDRYEEPQVVRYEMGQQFSWHYDALPASIAKKSGGQRIATILIYLNTVDAGGATTFKDLKIQVKPQKGKALIFFPCTVDGVPDDRTMHAGQVCFDTKWIAQIWIREGQYTPTIPEGNSHADAFSS